MRNRALAAVLRLRLSSAAAIAAASLDMPAVLRGEGVAGEAAAADTVRCRFGGGGCETGAAEGACDAVDRKGAGWRGGSCGCERFPSQQSALRKRTLSSGRTTRSSCTEVHEPLQMGREGRTFCRVSGGGVCGEAVRETIVKSRRELWRDGKWQNLWKPINFRSLWRINESAHTSRENAQGWEEGR